MAKPFCIPDMAVTTYAFPDTRLAVKVPLAVMPDPVNEKSNVEFANRFWAPVSTKRTTGNAAIILDEVRI